MTYKTTIIAIALILSASAHSKIKYPVRSTNTSCSDTSLLEQSRTADLFETPRNQGPMGWCYAYAAADLISAKLDKELSAFHIALLFNKGVGESFFLNSIYKLGQWYRGSKRSIYEGGWTDRNLEFLKKFETVCMEKDLSSQLDRGNIISGLLKSTKKIKTASLKTPKNTVSIPMLYDASISVFGALKLRKMA